MQEICRIYETLGLKEPEIKNNYDVERAIDNLFAVAGRKTLVVDEIQRCPQIVNWLISKHENSNTKLLLVLTGTPALGLKQPVPFKDNWQRIRLKLVLEPLSVLETLKLLQLHIPSHSTLDLIKLWTLTGGICRLVRSVLENVHNLDDEGLFAWLKAASYELKNGMTDAEFGLLSKLCPKKHLKVETVNQDTARALERRGALRRVDNDLAYHGQTFDYNYVIDNAYIVSSLSFDSNSNITKKEQIHKVSGIGFEDCLFKLFSDILLDDDGDMLPQQKLSLKLDGFEIAGYKPILISFGDYDVDGLLAQYKRVNYGKNDDESAFFVNRLVVFSLKLNGEVHQDQNKAEKFIKENVMNLVKRLPFLIEVTIFDCCPEFKEDSKRDTLDVWNSALHENEHLFKRDSLKELINDNHTFLNISQVCDDEFFSTDIKVNIKAVSMEEILTAAQMMVPIDYSTPADSEWPVISRKCFNNRNFSQLFQMHSQRRSGVALLSGYRGVGKTRALKSFITDGVFMELLE